MDSESIKKLTVGKIVEYALEEGTSYFLKVIRMSHACKTLQLEEEDIISEFALKLIENEGRQLFQFRGEAQFSTYVTVVFKNWLFPRLRRKREQEKNINSREGQFDNFFNIEEHKDSHHNPEKMLVHKESQKIFHETFEKCFGELNQDDQNLIRSIIQGEKKIKELALERKTSTQSIYYRYYSLLDQLRYCFQNDGFNADALFFEERE